MDEQVGQKQGNPMLHVQVGLRNVAACIYTRVHISGGTRALASARDFFVARFSLQTTNVLRVNNVLSIHGWSEMKTVLQEIASTREC